MNRALPRTHRPDHGRCLRLLTYNLILCVSQLDVSDNQLGPEGAKPLAIASLTNLDVRYNHMAGGPIENPRSRCSTRSPSRRCVQTRSQNGKGFGVEGGMVLAGLVMPSPTSVSLLCNIFDDEAVSMLLKLKEEKPALTTLCGLSPDQTEASFRQQGLKLADTKLLAPESAVYASRR